MRCPEWRRTPAVGVRDEVIGAAARSTAGAPLLAVEDLTIVYRTRLGTIVAAADVSFSIGARRRVALVGESGSGKTSVARCVAGLPAGRRADRARRRSRSRGAARSRSPTTGAASRSSSRTRPTRSTPAAACSTPSRGLRCCCSDWGAGRRRPRRGAFSSGYGCPPRIADRFPLELSGGERQRVAIARALAAGPELLVCDEVTSALDVSVQASVLDLLGELRSELGLALLFISHDLGVVASVCDRVLVLRDGTVREEGVVSRLLTAPADEYTRLLIDSAPRVAVP